MSEENPMEKLKGSGDSIVSPMLVYILYLVSLLTGITALVGLIMAYIAQGDADDVDASHYRFLIRTFWIGLLFSIIGGILMVVLIGFAILIFTLVWFIIRMVKGMGYANRGEPVPDPAAWLW